MHPTLGSLARFQAFFLRLSNFPVGRRSAARPSAGNANRWATPCIKPFAWFSKLAYLSNWRLNLQNQVSGLSKFVFLAVAFFQIFQSQKLAFGFFSQSFAFGFVRFSKLASWLRSKFLLKSGFDSSKSVSLAVFNFGCVRFLKSASSFSVKVLVNWVQAFSQVHFVGKSHSLQSHFFSKRFGKSGSGVFNFGSHGFSQVIIAKNKVVCKS